MEHAPLRPVPSRRAGPIDPALATREVESALPSLTGAEARALALVALAERPRSQAAALLGVDEHTLGDALATARKELRRTVTALPGSGWCERAERLISDRLDATLAESGPLTDTDARRLDAHLRNCPRCVEHERRLVQATDWLVSGLAPSPAPPAPPAPVEAPPTGETPVEEPPVGETPAGTPPVGTPPAGEAPAGTPLAGETPVEEPPAGQPPVEEPPIEVPPAEPPVEEPPVEEPTGRDTIPEEATAADATPAEARGASSTVAGPARADVAAAAEVLVAARTRRQLAAAVTWNAMIILAVLLTLATIGFTIAGILGAEL